MWKARLGLLCVCAVCARCSSCRVPAAHVQIPITNGLHLPSLQKPRPPVLVLTRISSCKEVTIATTRSIGERGERITEAEWEACGWQMIDRFSGPRGTLPLGRGFPQSSKSIQHPLSLGLGHWGHSPGSLKSSSCSSGCSSAEH